MYSKLMKGFQPKQEEKVQECLQCKSGRSNSYRKLHSYRLESS